MNISASSKSRRGVTFIEVIFSIGVVLIGLLGLLSILPLAGRRAQSAIDMAAASEYGDNVMNKLLTAGLLQGNLLRFQNSSTQFTLSYNSGTHALTVGGSPIQAICIDPLYRSSNGPNVSTLEGFSDENFPYFSREYNPLLNPTATDPAWKFDSSLTTITPVMNRFGVYRYVPSSGSYTVLAAEQARAFVESPDDLLVDRPKDRSQNAELPALSSGTSQGYGRRVPTGEFTWIATINPLEGNRFASISVAVISKRDRQNDFPTATLPITKPDNNASNERIAYVCDATGFSGGAGGSVRLVASESVPAELTTGDWIMLSRFTSTFDYNSQPLPDAVHRWYRVAAVDEYDEKSPPTVTNGTSGTADTVLGGKLPLPSGSATVRTRLVYLDGPDWNFGFETSGAENFSNNTFATLFQNVITVTERMVPLESL